jgi:hypothetical protein
MIRDPRTVVTSVHSGKGAKYFIGMFTTNTNSGFRDIGAAHYYEAIQRLPSPMVIGYEQLCEEPDKVQDLIGYRYRHVIGYKGFRGKFSNWHERARTPEKFISALGGVRSVLPPRSWKNPKHRDRIIKEFKSKEARDWVTRLGYEASDNWYQEII